VPFNLQEAESALTLPKLDYVIRTRLLFLVSILILGSLPLRAGTKIVHRWVLTDQPMPKLRNILVIGVLENYLIRQKLEDEMERLLAKSGVQGIRSHMVLPPRNELMEGELKQRIKEGDFDGVLVIRPRDMRKETKEVVTSLAAPYYVPPAAYHNFWPYWNMAWGQAYYRTSSSVKEYTYVSTEFNLYSTKDEKLLWSGETESVYSKDFGKLAREYARALAQQLKKDKVIGTK
jgi:hypothetical protein